MDTLTDMARPKTGETPNRNLRVADAIWKPALLIAKRKKEPLTAVITRALEAYIAENAAILEQPDEPEVPLPAAIRVHTSGVSRMTPEGITWYRMDVHAPGSVIFEVLKVADVALRSMLTEYPTHVEVGHNDRDTALAIYAALLAANLTVVDSE